MDIAAAFAELSTPLVADACLRCGVELRAAPAGIRPLAHGARAAGRVLPARHYGSVDVFLEALNRAEPGAVLVADDGGRDDEACIGDLVALEAAGAGVTAVVIWGRHRDTSILRTLPIAVWSRGAHPKGPAGVREAQASIDVSDGDLVVADEDGALVVPAASAERILELARDIERVERDQAERANAGVSLREQFRFAEYLERRAAQPGLTFRQHLREISAEVER